MAVECVLKKYILQEKSWHLISFLTICRDGIDFQTYVSTGNETYALL